MDEPATTALSSLYYGHSIACNMTVCLSCMYTIICLHVSHQRLRLSATYFAARNAASSQHIYVARLMPPAPASSARLYLQEEERCLLRSHSLGRVSPYICTHTTGVAQHHAGTRASRTCFCLLSLPLSLYMLPALLPHCLGRRLSRSFSQPLEGRRKEEETLCLLLWKEGREYHMEGGLCSI